MKIDHESLTGTFEQKRALVAQFNLMHDDFFAVVMQDKKAFEVVLRILTQRNDLIVKEVRTQYSMRNLVGHSVTLDAFAEDTQGKLYNVEVQICDNDYHEKRVRYYQSSIDMSMLEKGVSYKKLPDLYLIFICSFDIFKEHKASYEVKRVLNNSGKEIPNGIHELYFNTSVKEDNDISALLQYFENSSPEIEEYGKLSERVKFYKETQEGVSNMCEAVREYCDERAAIAKKEGRAEGKAEERKAIIEKMKQRGMSEEEIKAILAD